MSNVKDAVENVLELCQKRICGHYSCSPDEFGRECNICGICSANFGHCRRDYYGICPEKQYETML